MEVTTMKEQLNKLVRTFAVAGLILLMPACATQTSNVADADAEMGRALITAGFKVRPASTASQRTPMAGMPDNRFTVVNQNGNQYYLYADKRDNRLYVGDRFAYQAFIGNEKNNKLRKEGAFVFEVNPSDKANNKTVTVWPGYPPFRDW
jgi:hypothetical protein